MTNQDKPHVAIWWVLWLGMLSGIPMFYLLLGGNQPTSAAKSPFWFVGLAPLFVSVFIRWIVLPRLNKGSVAFPLFMVGLATAEATCFFGLFLFPAHKQELFILGALGMAQFAPYYASRYS